MNDTILGYKKYFLLIAINLPTWPVFSFRVGFLIFGGSHQSF